jgi:D-3-phosphoglycerate dehydrogenase
MKRHTLIIDFDSTFIQVKALDELAKLTLKNHPEKEQIQKEIEEITKQRMEGSIDFAESLAQRLFLFKPSRTDIADLVQYLKKKISPSIKKNKDFFLKNNDSVYVISGGFREYIEPVVTTFGIPSNHILANEFQFNSKGTVIGFNDKIVLSKPKGKVKAVRKLKLKGSISVLGDGYTDYEIKKEKAAKSFYAFTENISRESVTQYADGIIPSFDIFLKGFKSAKKSLKKKSNTAVISFENIDAKKLKEFKKAGLTIKNVSKKISDDQLIVLVKHAKVLAIRSKTPITQKILNHAKHLVAICVLSKSNKNIDLDACTERGIAVFEKNPVEHCIQYMNHGSVISSLNFPEINFEKNKNTTRIIHIHKNVPGVLANINKTIAKQKMKIESQYVKTNAHIGYAIVDIHSSNNRKIVSLLKDVPHSIMIRTI